MPEERKTIKRAPGVEILSKTEEEIRFVMHGVNAALAANLRRVMMVDLVTVAFDLCQIEQNNSVMGDQMLVHQIGLVPIQSTNADLLIDSDKCLCINKLECVRCGVKFTLDVKHTGEGIRAVTSDDLVCEDPRFAVASDGYGPIVLTKISQGHHIKLVAIAQRGTARRDAKWMTVSRASAHPCPEIEILPPPAHPCPVQKPAQQQQQNVWTTRDMEDFVASCPKKIFCISPEKRNVEVIRSKVLDCDYCGECTLWVKKHFSRAQGEKKTQEEAVVAQNMLSVTPSKNKYLFIIETTHQLTVQEIVQQSFKVLKEELTAFEKELVHIQKKEEEERSKKERISKEMINRTL